MDRYEALKHAVKAHAGTLDKCGQPYVLHPIAVAEAIERSGTPPSLYPEQAIYVALLHDVLEDTEYALPASLFSDRQGAAYLALLALTHRNGQTYREYIDVVRGSEIASFVKLADIWHNLQPERQACLPEKERLSLEKRYLKARDRIWEALGYRWWPDRQSEEGGR